VQLHDCDFVCEYNKLLSFKPCAAHGTTTRIFPEIKAHLTKLPSNLSWEHELHHLSWVVTSLTLNILRIFNKRSINNRPNMYVLLQFLIAGLLLFFSDKSSLYWFGTASQDSCQQKCVLGLLYHGTPLFPCDYQAYSHLKPRHLTQLLSEYSICCYALIVQCYFSMFVIYI
jgi:hypothetical protein